MAKMTELRTDSTDYRTELLSPNIAAENVSMARQPSWRISMDEHRLPERQMESHFGFGLFLRTMSTSIQQPFIHISYLYSSFFNVPKMNFAFVFLRETKETFQVL
jgi:hypothetical protein